MNINFITMSREIYIFQIMPHCFLIWGDRLLTTPTICNYPSFKKLFFRETSLNSQIFCDTNFIYYHVQFYFEYIMSFFTW